MVLMSKHLKAETLRHVGDLAWHLGQTYFSFCSTLNEDAVVVSHGRTFSERNAAREA